MASSDSDSEEIMPIGLKDIRTIRELFQTGILRSVSKPKYPVHPPLLERVSLFQGDITKLEIDSIVNAANGSLLGGGGVDGAIHAAAGRKLQQSCRELYPDGCDTGDAKITGAFNLPSKHIIHAVGPKYFASSDVNTKSAQLASCYRTGLELAVQNSLKHIAFPSISTGIYGYPIEDATHVALDETRRFLDSADGEKLDRVIFVVWSDKDKSVYEELIPEYFPSSETPLPSPESAAL